MFDFFKKKKTNYGKIIAITIACVAGAQILKRRTARLNRKTLKGGNNNVRKHDQNAQRC